MEQTCESGEHHLDKSNKEMKYFSAQYIFTNAGPPSKRAVICAEDDGTIVSLEDTGGRLSEKESVAFYNGIIIPGFVNCHCHLELSWLKGEIPKGTGLSNFLIRVNSLRNTPGRDRNKAAADADNEMLTNGIVLCADICNSSDTFHLKKKSGIKYINLLEVFGIDSSKAHKRIEEIMLVAGKAEEEKLPWWIVPHAVYSISLPLFRLIKEYTESNKITSLHFLESQDERSFLADHSGPLMEAYKKFLPPLSALDTPGDHVSAVLDEVTGNGNLLLVHNTRLEWDVINKLRQRENLYYCLCPNSNMYINNTLPPAGLLSDEGCDIVIGTDSLSSNHALDILDELRTLQENRPDLPLESLISWATINGARALCEDSWAGSIEPGKKPGLLLIENLDLMNLKLLPASGIRRIL
jgi:cytosine/adenosine deaminase-related metal-dependent hydrolase